MVRIPSPVGEEVFLSLPARAGESPAGLFQRLYGFVEQHPHLRIVRQDVFGILGGEAGDAPRSYRLAAGEWPVTWVEQGRGGGSPVAGIQIHALSGVAVKPLTVEGRVVGVLFEDEWARHCILAGMRPANPGASRAVQTFEILELMETALGAAGMSFTDVFRTWFYLDAILDWYDEFNRVRNDFFRRRGVFDGLVPASTGVGGSNGSGTAVVADLLAIQPKRPETTCRPMPSPLQCPALDYGSSFSRAVEVARPGQRRLYVSGTASIYPDGRTAHVGDSAAQLQLTMDVVEAILSSRGMAWTDTVRGIAYFKNMDDLPLLTRWCAAQGLEGWPVIAAKNDICRDDLLFELELDAIAPG